MENRYDGTADTQRPMPVGGKFMGEGPGEFIAPHGIAMDSHGDFYVAEVAFTAKGRHENPPREIRSLQKFALARP